MIENRAFYPWTHCFTRYLAVLWHNFGLLISWGRFCTCPAAERENCFTIRRPSNSKGWIMLCSNRLKNSARVTALMSECLWYVWWLMKETACPSYVSRIYLIQTFVSRAQDTFCGSKKNCPFHDCLSFRLWGLMIGEECIRNIPQDAEDIKATNPNPLFAFCLCMIKGERKLRNYISPFL